MLNVMFNVILQRWNPSNIYRQLIIYNCQLRMTSTVYNVKYLLFMLFYIIQLSPIIRNVFLTPKHIYSYNIYCIIYTKLVYYNQFSEHIESYKSLIRLKIWLLPEKSMCVTWTESYSLLPTLIIKNMSRLFDPNW